MIHVDNPMTFDIRFKDYCHLWSATMDLDELNGFAALIGLKPAWLQHSQGVYGIEFWHYDISKGKRAQALRLGAVYKPLAQWIQEQRQLKAAE